MTRRSPLWAIEHSRLLGHQATETGCEDCAAVPPMHDVEGD